MKAAIARAGFDKYPDSARKGHDLAEIAKCRVEGGRTLHRLIQADKGIRGIFNVVLSASAWQMHHRYSGYPLGEESLLVMVGKYGRIYKWITSRFR